MPQPKSPDTPPPWPIPPSLLSCANAVGRKEGEGPLADTFDLIDSNDTFGQKSWERSERAMLSKALTMALAKEPSGAPGPTGSLPGTC